MSVTHKNAKVLQTTSRKERTKFAARKKNRDEEKLRDKERERRRMELDRLSQKAREMAEREARKERLRQAEEREQAGVEPFPALVPKVVSILDAYETPKWPKLTESTAAALPNGNNTLEDAMEDQLSHDSNSTPTDPPSPAREKEAPTESSPAREKEAEPSVPSVVVVVEKAIAEQKQQQESKHQPQQQHNPPPPVSSGPAPNFQSRPNYQQQPSKSDPSSAMPPMATAVRTKSDKELIDLLQSKVNTLEYLLFQKNNTIELHVVNTSRLGGLCEQQRLTLEHAQASYSRLQEVLRALEKQEASQAQRINELEIERDNYLNVFMAFDQDIERKIEDLETTISDQQTQIDSLTRQQQQLQLLSEQPASETRSNAEKNAKTTQHPTSLQKNWPIVLESVCLGRNLPAPKYNFRRHIQTGMYLVTTEVNGVGMIGAV
jgi:hypothetical protein